MRCSVIIPSFASITCKLRKEFANKGFELYQNIYRDICISCTVYMYIRPSQPETPRLRNSPAFSAGAHDNKTIYLATIGYETAQNSTSSLHAAFRLLLTSPIASARATRLLAIPPYWLTSFAPRGRGHFHCSLG